VFHAAAEASDLAAPWRVRRILFVEKEHNRDVIQTPLGVTHDVGVV
jgi:hypothetical protein